MDPDPVVVAHKRRTIRFDTCLLLYNERLSSSCLADQYSVESVDNPSCKVYAKYLQVLFTNACACALQWELPGGQVEV